MKLIPTRLKSTIPPELRPYFRTRRSPKQWLVVGVTVVAVLSFVWLAGTWLGDRLSNKPAPKGQSQTAEPFEPPKSDPIKTPQSGQSNQGTIPAPGL